MYFIDTHAHIDMLKGLTPEEAVAKSENEGVKYIINVGSSLDSSKKSIEFARKFSNVFASVGVHPHYVSNFGKKEIKILQSLIQGYSGTVNENLTTPHASMRGILHPHGLGFLLRGRDQRLNSTGLTSHLSDGIQKVYHKQRQMPREKRLISSLLKQEALRRYLVSERYKKVVAVGETGFDFYRNLSPRIDMERAFVSHIELAIKYDIPVIIHDRDAHKQTLEVVRKYIDQKNFRAVVHCFSGDVNFAMQCLDLGLYISFTGVITFPNARDILKAVEKVPVERLFIETDAPFLAPQAKRGKENYPGYVRYVAEKIAEIKNLSVEEVADITSKNAERFFSIN
ncbi:D-aminoacyl-tRNA deacylase [subsurface metagenome]|nr:hypothetical protein [Clostridia bacterium]